MRRLVDKAGYSRWRSWLTLIALVSGLVMLGWTWSGAGRIPVAAADSTLPPPWVENDVGYPIAGSASFNSGVYTVTGNGSTIGSGWDKFHYVSQPLNGDNSITTRLSAFSHPSAGGLGSGIKYGVMIREDLAIWKAGRNVMLAFNPTGSTTGQLIFQYRTDDWAGTTATVISSSVSLPLWLKLDRTGNTFTGWTSPTGMAGSWTQAGTIDIPMATNANIGLAVCSGDDATLDTAVFDHVKAPVTPSTLPVPWGQSDIGNPSQAGSADYAGGVFSLTGNGSTIGSTWDKFHYVSRPFVGDGNLTVRLAGYNHGGVGGNARYGLMIRENLTPWVAGRNITLGFNPGTTGGSGQVFFQHRDSEGGDTQVSAGLNGTLPLWFKLERAGNTFTGWLSTSGAAGSWQSVGSVNLNLGVSLWVGMVVNSGDDSTLDSASFDNVTFSDSRIGAPWQTTDLGYPAQNGVAAFSAGSGSYTVAGSGSGLITGTDQFQFTNRPFTSDGSLTARLAGFTHSASPTVTGQYGLMLREDLAAAGTNRYVFVGLNSSNQLFFQYRAADSSVPTTTVSAGGPVAGPVYLKLQRQANTFTGWRSSTGAAGSWQLVGTVNLDFTPSLYVGPAVASGDTNVLDNASFDNLSLVLQPVSVNINWSSSLVTVTRQNFGLNAFQDSNPAVAGDPTYTANMNYMRPGLLRYHSWEILNDSSQGTGWLDTAHQSWDAAKIDTALSALAYTDTVRLINIPGWPSWMDTDNDGYLDAGKADQFAAFCADLVRIANVTYPGHHVTYWEVTNERDDPYYVQLVNAGKPDRLDELIDIYNRAARAMKAVEPTIQVGGPAFARGGLYPQVQRFVAGTITQTNPTTLDFLSFHAYASGDLHDSDDHIYDRAYNPTQPTVNSFAKHTYDIRNILNAASPNRAIPLWLDEYNISWTWQNNDPRMQNYKGGVFDALVMAAVLNNGANGTAAWNDKDGVYGKMDNGYVLRPSADVYHLLNNYLTGRQVATSQNITSTIVTLAVKDDTTNRRSVLLINRSPLNQTVSLNFQGWQPTNLTFDRYEAGPAGLVTSTISLVALNSGQLNLPNDSVTVLTLVDGLLVTNPTDRGPTLDNNLLGTFSYALGHAQNGQIIRFSLSSGSNVIAVNGQLPSVPQGVTLQGKYSCSDPGPNVVLDGSNAPPGTHGLVLNGGDHLMGLTIQSFSGWLLKNTGYNNRLECVVAHK